jgi:hypothetical protein
LGEEHSSINIRGQSVFTRDVPAKLMVDGHVQLCIMQTPRIDQIDVIRTDQSRAENVSALRDLFNGRPGVHDVPVLRELVPQNQTTVVILPEYAAGSPDWYQIDEIVRSVTRPIVLIVGFGATPGKWVIDWHNRVVATGSPTARELTWDQNANPIGNVLLVNGAWCWLHNFGFATTCLTFLKNHLEQSTEAVELASLQSGNTLLHLRFQDVDLFPMICADLVRPQSAGANVPISIIATFLKDQPNNGRRILVTGSLLQPKPNINWEVAIDGIVNGIAPGRNSVLVLANQAVGSPVGDESVDKWRSISGVFTRFSDLQKQASIPAGRTLKTAAAIGMIVRESGPCVTAGPIFWPPYGPITGQFVWHPGMSVPLRPAGIAHPVLLPKPISEAEVDRFTKRYPRKLDWSPRVETGLNIIRQQISSPIPPNSKVILNSSISGVGVFCDEKYFEFNPDELGTDPTNDSFQVAVHAIATLITINGIGWQRNENNAGQLKRPAENTNILVWRDPNRNSREMKRLLGTWMQTPGEHPKLIVVGEGYRSQLDEGLLVGDRRDNVSEAPPNSEDLGAIGTLAASIDDLTAPSGTREVACVCLHRVSEFYMNYEAANEGTRLAALESRLVNAFQG